MKYFVTQISTVNGQTAIGTFEQLRLNDAKSMYYQTLASFFANPNIEYFLVQIIDENGEVIIQDHYKYQPQVMIAEDPEPTE